MSPVVEAISRGRHPGPRLRKELRVPIGEISVADLDVDQTTKSGKDRSHTVVAGAYEAIIGGSLFHRGVG
jgi:hypothetical protein